VADKELAPDDRWRQEKARDILVVLGKAVSAFRLYPSDNPTVRNFISDLFERLSEYLEKEWELEVGVGEQGFFLDGKMIFHDPNPARGLPFFFFKDGMKMFAFHGGLQRSELDAFLKVIREVSQLPPDEGDIVNALWELDLPNIRQVAPDDFLETKIGVGRAPLRPELNMSSLDQGRIDLTPEDLEEIRKGILTLEKSKAADGTEAGSSFIGDIDRTPADTSDRELAEVEALLAANRQLSQDDEYLSLILEIIYLEDRPEQFPAIANILEQYHQEAIQKKEFRRAAKLLQALTEIKELYATKNKLKSDLMESVISLVTRQSQLVDLHEGLDPDSISDSKGLFDYLLFFGTRSVGLVADVYERATSRDFRLRALEILKEIGKTDLHELMKLVQESRPELSQEIIRMLGESADPGAVHFLANIVAYKSVPVKLAAIRALGRIPNEAADKVLLGFLADANEEVRVAALNSMKRVSDRQGLAHIIETIRDKGFVRRSGREKTALFGALGRSDSEEACSFLRGILARVPFLPSSRHTELCLCAIGALEKMDLPGAREALKKGAKRRHHKIRSASLKALKTKAETPITYTGRTPR